MMWLDLGVLFGLAPQAVRVWPLRRRWIVGEVQTELSRMQAGLGWLLWGGVWPPSTHLTPLPW